SLLRTFGVAGAGVQSIDIFGLAGDDVITVSERIAAPIAIFAGDGDDTLIGPDVGLIYTVTGEGSGSVHTFLRFDGVEMLRGGSGDDVFQMAGGSLLGGSAPGIDGGTGSDTIQGADAATVWTLTGAGIGTIDADTRFIGIENLRGGTDTDTFSVSSNSVSTGSLSGILDGGTIEIDGTTLLPTSTNTLDFSGSAGPITIDLATESGGGIAGFANITGVTGTGGSDTLRGPAPLADQVRWTITGTNSGMVDGVTFSGFENLIGRDTTNDAFVFAGGTVAAVNGGVGGVDGIAVDESGVLRAFQPATSAGSTGGFKGLTVNYTGLEAFDPIGGTATDRVVNGSIFDRSATLTPSGSTFTLTFSGLTFGAADQSVFTFAQPTASLTLVTGTGGDDITTSVDPDYAFITYHDGTLTVWLRNTAAVDDAELALDSTVTDPASVDGGLIVTLTVNGFLQRFGSFGSGVRFVNVTGRAGDDTFSVRETLPIEIAFDGGVGGDTLQGPVRGTNWTITGDGIGKGGGVTSFAGVERLVGGSATTLGTATDRFVFEVGGAIGSIDGGAGTDQLVGPAQTNIWNITGTNTGALNTTNFFTNIENLTGGSGNDTFNVGAGGAVTGVIDGGLDVDTSGTGAGTPPIDTLSFASAATAVLVDLGLATATGVAGFSGIDVIVGGSGTGDTFTGPGTSGEHVVWRITGLDAGEVDGVLAGDDVITTTSFSGFENLRGRGTTSDSFLFTATGRLTGVLDGGTGPGAVDGLAVSDGTMTTVFMPPSSAGVVTIHGRTITYAGLDDPTAVLTGDDDKRVITGSIFADTIVLENDSEVDWNTVTLVGFNFWDGIGAAPSLSHTVRFVNPGTSLTIEAGSGGDTITVKTLDPGFAAELYIYGNKGGAPMIEPDPGRDKVTFEGDVSTGGGYLEVFADEITVAAGATLSTLPTGGALEDGADIVFRARRFGTPEIENLLPVGYLSKTVAITIGAGAIVSAGSIYLIAQAEDRSLATTLGLTTLGAQVLLDPFLSAINDLVALPLKVLIKASTATVTVGTDAQLLADYTIGIYATAGADASGSASSQLVSIGYSQATATAIIDIQSGARVIANNGPVNITSDASATASMSTSTSREEQGAVPGKRGSGFSGSLAVSWASVTSTTTVAQNAEVLAGRTVNIRALGTSESEAEAESSLYADGAAAIAIALEFSTADILTRIEGTVTGNHSFPGGEVVRFEFDPTVKASNWTSDQTIARLRTGETVQLQTAFGALPVRTVMKYLGPDISSSVNLSTQTYDGNPVWEVTSEPWGYIDTFNDRISVTRDIPEGTNWVVLTEDTVDYKPNRGSSIGGLSPGTYVVVLLPDNPTTAVDESRYIQLARTEQLAIDAYTWAANENNVGINPYVVNLTPGATTSTRTFDTSDIDDDVITFDGVGNTFALGQAVLYYEADRTATDRVVDGFWQSPNASIDGSAYIPLIDGLVHGQQYYVMAGTNQFNLDGDQRLVSGQSIQLGILENEVRAGIARIKLTPSAAADGRTGFRLIATHYLDSGFKTFGIVAALDATDSASATAGLSAEDVDEKKKDDPPYDLDSSAFDNIFNKASETYGSNSSAGGSNAKASIQIGGALAFSYTRHSVRTWITNTADLNSNDDLEVVSDIQQSLTLKAESSGEEQPGKKDAKGKPAANTSADSSISLAIVIGVQNNTSRAIVGCSTDTADEFYCAPGAGANTGPSLDGLREMRVLSGVTYPFLTRIDEFVPTSFSGFADRLETEGFDFVNTYLDGTLGLSSLFNTQARSTTSADKLAIAGSINLLLFTNVAESIVHSGAQLNQDPFYRVPPCYDLRPGDIGYQFDCDPTLGNYNPAFDYGDIVRSLNASNVDQQAVSIEAVNYMQFMNVTGVFGFKITPSLELSSPRLSADPNKIVGLADLDTDYDNSLTPARGGRGGVGGAIFLQFLDNTTKAVIESGVSLYSGRDGGLNLKAEEAIMGFAFSQAGASADKVAVGGTFAYFEQKSETLAQIEEGASITGGRVDVYAGSLETQINWAGGVARSKAIGAGVAIAINNITRDTRAVIGGVSDSAGSTQGTIDVVGAVTARAIVTGAIYAFTVAGAYANASGQEDEPEADAGGNADDSDPLDGISLPLLFDEAPPGDDAKQKKAGTSVAIAAAVAVNNVTDTTQASIGDYSVAADAIDVRAENGNNIVAATGGLAFSKTDSGGNAAALAGAFSYNGIHATTDAWVGNSTVIVRDADFERMLVESAAFRFSILATTRGSVWTLAAGGGGAVAGGGNSDSSGGSLALSLAGAVSVNIITGSTRARMIDTVLTLDELASDAAARGPPENTVSDVVIRATDSSDIFAISGGLSLAIAEGGKGKATAVAFGVAIAVNTITTDTDALVEDSTLTWVTNTTGSLLVEATSTGSIQAFTVAGAFGAAIAKQQGSGVAATGAGSGSVNRIDADTTAIIRRSTVTAAGSVTVHAANDSNIVAGAGAVALSFAVAGKGTAAAIAIGASFAINFLRGTTNADGAIDTNDVTAEIDESSITAADAIDVIAEMNAGIFALGIGATASVAGSNDGFALAFSLAGSLGYNQIHNLTQARVMNGSTLTTLAIPATSAQGVSVVATDDSWINSTAGAVALALAFSQKTAVAPALGISVTINEITSTTRAVVENSTIVADGVVGVRASSTGRIDSLGFGIALAVAISLDATAIGVAATGAISSNKITTIVEATIRNTATGTGTVSAGGPISVTASNDATIKAIAIAASASVSAAVGFGKPSISISIGIALAHNRIDGRTSARIAGISSVLTPAAVSVTATDTSYIEVTSIAAALAVAVGLGISVGVAGGASESTNVILGATSASVESSTIGSASNPVASVVIGASSNSTIKAIVGAVAAAVAVGKNAVAVAIGIAVARNFIGEDPNSSTTAGFSSTDYLHTLTPHTKVKITGSTDSTATPSAPMYGDVFEYIGTNDLTPRFDWASDHADTVDLAKGRRVKLVGTTAGNGTVYEYTARADHESTEMSVALETGQWVRVGNEVYRYLGTSASAVDLRGENYATTPGRWVLVANPGSLTGVNLAAEDFALARWRKVGALEGQDFLNPQLWKQINLDQRPISVQAFIQTSTIHTDGLLHVHASGTQKIDAIVFSAALGLAAGVGAGVGVAGAGTYAENRIRSNVEAFTNATTATAATMKIEANDSSQIDAKGIAAAVAVAIGGDVGVAVAIGLTIAFNDVDVDVDAHAFASTLTTSRTSATPTIDFGDIVIRAVTSGAVRFDLVGNALITAANLDDATEAEDDDPNNNSDPLLPGEDESIVDATNDSEVLKALEAAVNAEFPLRSGKWNTDDTLQPLYTSKSGVHDLKRGDTVLHGGTIYVFVPVEGDAVDLGSETYAANPSRWVTGFRVALSDGDVVRDATTGNSYRYVDPDTSSKVDLIDLGAPSFSGGLWEYDVPDLKTIKPGEIWQFVAGSDIFLVTKTASGFQVSRPTIQALAVAASLAFALGGGVGVAVAGAGAYARNDITGSTNAYASGSVLKAGANVIDATGVSLGAVGSVEVAAIAAAEIVATVVGAAVAVGIGLGAAGVGASIGIAISDNRIGARTEAGARQPFEVRAYLLDTAVDAAERFEVRARSSEIISAVVVAASVAVGAASSVGVAFSGAGAVATNTIIADIKATIDGNGPSGSAVTGITADTIEVTATDTSRISAVGVGASVAASFGGLAGIALSIAVSIGRNEIDNRIEASI
ncbi:MAG: hypothetical protein ABIP17_01255, partial [Ilumatobacteraceae bacterium]